MTVPHGAGAAAAVQPCSCHYGLRSLLPAACPVLPIWPADRQNCRMLAAGPPAAGYPRKMAALFWHGPPAAPAAQPLPQAAGLHAACMPMAVCMAVQSICAGQPTLQAALHRAACSPSAFSSMRRAACHCLPPPATPKAARRECSAGCLAVAASPRRGGSLDGRALKHVALHLVQQHATSPASSNIRAMVKQRW